MSFVDTGADIVDAGGGIGVDPVSSPAAPVAAPVNAGGDALAQAAMPGNAGNPFSMAGMAAAGPSPSDFGGMGVAGTGWGDYNPGTAGDGTVDTSISGSDPNMGLAGDNSPGPQAGSETKGIAALANQPISSVANQPTSATPTADKTADRLPGAGGGAGGAQGVNAMTTAANAFRSLAQAAQAGNPQAQQLMNMLRQAMMQQQMAGMMGGGQQYNPYMNQFDPWAARMRMHEMRRRFMEAQRERQKVYGHGVAGGPVTHTGRGRR